jgi:hypothetical protein
MQKLEKLGGSAVSEILKPQTEAISLFSSYAHKDEALRDELDTHLALLRNQGTISSWHDRSIPVGSEWDAEISENLESAQIILLLVSANFLASEYIWGKELKRAMERHEAGEARVIPITLKPCDWHSAAFGKLQALPKGAKAVTKWSDRDEAFTDVALGIRKTVEGMRNP